MSSKQDLIEIKEVISQCNELIKQQSQGWAKIVEEIKKVNSSAPSSYIKMQKEVAQSVINAEKAEQQYQKTLQQKQVLEQKILQTEKQKIQLSETARRANEAQQKSLQRATQTALNNSSAYLKLQTNWRNAQRAYADLLSTVNASPQAIAKARNEFELLDKKIKQVDTATKNYSKNVGNYSSAFSGLSSLGGQLAGALGWAGAIATVVSLGRSAYDTTKQLQILDKSMELGAKSSADYASNIVFLKKVTEDYGLELITTSQAYNKFYIASKNKLALEDIQLIFDKVSKSASLMGMSVYEQEGIFKALEQMMSKGTVQAEELRGQLGDRLPGAFEIMANAMGVSTAKLGDMMKNGEVMASEVLPKFAIELEKAYGANQVTKVDNLTSAENRLKNAWTDFISEVNGSNNAIGNFGINFMNMITALIAKVNELAMSREALFNKNKDVFKNQGFNSAYSTYSGVDAKNKYIEETYLNDLNKKYLRRKEILSDISKLEKTISENSKKGFFGSNNVGNEADNILKLKNELQGIDGYMRGMQKAWKENVTGKKEDKNKFFPFVEPELPNAKNLEKAEKERLKRLIEIAKQEQATAEASIKRQIEEAKFAGDKELQYALEQQLALTTYKAKEKIAELEIKDTEQLKSRKIELAEEFTSQIIKINQTESKEFDKKYEEDLKDYQKYLDLRLKAKQDALNKEEQEQLEAYRREDDRREKVGEKVKAYATDFSFGSFGFSSLDVLKELDMFVEAWDRGMLTIEEKTALVMTSIANVVADTMNIITNLSNQRFQVELQNLETNKDVALKFAGDSASGREAIEAQYEAKRKDIQKRQAQAEKKQAIFNIAMSTAQALISLWANPGFPAAIPLMAVVGSLGATQAALVASQPIPEFWTGTDNAPEGLALTQERGAEMITDKNGRIKTLGNDKGAQLTYLNKGDKVYNASDTTDKINEMLMGSGISPIVKVENKGLTKTEMIDVMNQTLARQPKQTTKFDEKGVTLFIEKENSRTIKRGNNARI